MKHNKIKPTKALFTNLTICMLFFFVQCSEEETVPRKVAPRFNTDSAHHEPKTGTFSDRPNPEPQPKTGHTTRRMSAWGALKVISTENPPAQRVFESLRKRADQMRRAVARGVDFRLLNIEDIRHLQVNGKDHVFIPFTGHRNGYQLVLAAHLPSDGAPVQIYLQETTPTEQIREGTAYHLRYYSLDMTAINVLPADSRLNNLKKQRRTNSARSGGGCGSGGSRLPTIILPSLVITAPRYTPSRTFHIPHIPFIPRLPSSTPRVPPGYGTDGFSSGSGSTGRWHTSDADRWEAGNITKTRSFEDNTCANSTWNDLTDSNALYSMLKQFINNSFNMNLNLQLDVQNYSCPRGNICRGKTTPVSNGFRITLNSDYLQNASSIAIAKTILHEAIHAHLGYYVKTIRRDNNISINDFPGILDYFRRYGSSNWQHEQMAAHYRSVMIKGMKDFDSTNRNSHTNSFYTSLSWSGLTGTQSWNNLSSVQKSRIRSTYQSEDTKGGCN